jgi:hypothetical protein
MVVLPPRTVIGVYFSRMRKDLEWPTIACRYLSSQNPIRCLEGLVLMLALQLSRSGHSYGLDSSPYGGTLELSMRIGPEAETEAKLHGIHDSNS